jgi:hypothetical protein
VLAGDGACLLLVVRGRERSAVYFRKVLEDQASE